MRERLRDFFARNDVRERSAESCGRLISSRRFAESGTVLSFMSSGLEIETETLNAAALESGKGLFVPKVVSETEIEFFKIEKGIPLESQLESGRFSIREPKGFLERMDFGRDLGKILVAVPGVAFCADGRRCGHGRGFYDRFLRRLRSSGLDFFASGLCLPCQVVGEIPVDGNDERLDAVFF